MSRVFVVGSLNYDITHRVGDWPGAHAKVRSQACWSGPGGSAANTAYWLGRGGARVLMVGSVGDDDFGHRCIDSLDAAAVDTTWVRRTAGTSTGIASVLLCNDEKCIVTCGTGGAALPAALPPSTIVRSGDHVHLAAAPSSTLAGWVARVQASGASISVDWNGRDHRGVLERIDLSFMNHDELVRLPGTEGQPAASAVRLAALCGGQVVVTQGAHGASAYAAGGEHWFRPAVPVEVVDRTGGGDAFDAGFLLRWLGGASCDVCLDAGLALAAQVLQRRGTR